MTKGQFSIMTKRSVYLHAKSNHFAVMVKDATSLSAQMGPVLVMCQVRLQDLCCSENEQIMVTI